MFPRNVSTIKSSNYQFLSDQMFQCVWIVEGEKRKPRPMKSFFSRELGGVQCAAVVDPSLPCCLYCFGFFLTDAVEGYSLTHIEDTGYLFITRKKILC